MIPTFKYHPDPLKTGAFSQGEVHTCGCCGKQTDVWYEQPFHSSQDVECLCPECIASGKAAEKFDGEFVDACSVGEVSDSAKLDELVRRTPCYIGWQQEYWYAHCDDFCEFDFEDIKECLTNNGSMQGYLFRCLHCGEYFLYADCD